MAAPLNQDIISIKSLSLPHAVTVPDNWDKRQKKPQPAFLSVRLTLAADSFKSAASGDQLNQNTVHYGELSKAIRKASVDGQSLDQLVLAVAQIFARYTAIQRWRCEICLPKGSMAGSRLRLSVDRANSLDSHTVNLWTWVVQGLQVPCLIGVNANERTGRQPVLVEFEIAYTDGNTPRLADFVMGEIIDLEKALVEIIGESSFETLEALAEHAYEVMLPKIFHAGFENHTFRLKIEKPRAIIFADAPAIEIHRSIR